MSETIVLDPSAVATGRTEFDITGLIQSAGVDWGDAAIESYMAESTRGQVPVDYRVPNRTVTIPLVVKAITGLTYDQARQKLQAKVGLIHREGGWLKRIVSGTPLYADVVNATLKLGGSGLQSLRSFDVDATLSLECLPEFYGDEITLDDMTETTAAELVKVLKLSAATAVIKGDYPARTRIVVDEDQGVAQRGLLWGLRARYYDAATTAALAYEAELMTPLDAATVTSMATTGSLPTASVTTNIAGTANSSTSTTLTSVSNTAAWRNGMAITGSGIPAGATIVSGAGTATMILSAATTTSLTGFAITGISDAVKHPSLTTDWTPVLKTDLWQGGALTHKGSYRVWARVYSPSGFATITTQQPARPRARFVWDVGDLTNPASNSSVTLPKVNGFVDVDLGEVRLDAAPSGTHRWFGMVQVAGAVAGQTFYIDKLWFVPAAEGYGLLRAVSPDASAGLSAFTARDGFDQTSGALAGKTLPIGGSWVGGGLSASDFTVTGSGRAQRATSSSDLAGPGDMRNGRLAIAGTSQYTNAFVQVTGSLGASTSVEWGVFARYVDINNFICVQIIPDSVNNETIVQLVAFVGGTRSSFGTYTFPSNVAGSPGIVRMFVEETGRCRVWYYTTAAVDSSPPILDSQLSELATGGTLATGKVGFCEMYFNTTGTTRQYDDFLAWQPTPDAVMYASQSAELRSDGMFREDSSGTSYGPISQVVGDLPRLPPSGLEARSVEVFVKGTRGDLDQLGDSNIDDISARVFYRPCWLFVPA